MATMLRVLIVEDDEADALLVLRELQRGGFEVTSERVETESQMEAALERPWDVIISDYSMPRLGAVRALAILAAHDVDIPFLIVSGTVDEESAVSALKAGAHDFMTKSKLARLVPAVERERREAALRAEQARMREQLVLSDRMASVGMLAAGIAHEINNPLAAIMAYLDLAADDVGRLLDEIRGRVGGSGADARTLAQVDESLQDARQCADRVRSIVRDVRLFSRSDEAIVGPVDVRRVLESSVRMAWNEVRHRARLVKEYEDVPPVLGSEGRLGQVFLNLLVNAAQATPEGNAEENEIRVRLRQDDAGRVEVDVRDTGAGMPPAVLRKIFDPFFTTKPAGVGTGLGLAICHRIVAEVGGTIVAESEVGRGTCVRVTLPATQQALPDRAEPVAAAGPHRRARILVVDDEPAIGTAIGRILGRLHEVAVVASARAAISRIAAGERFDVILCDLMMGVMTGMDLYAAVARIAPEQAERIAFMTGGAFTPRAREFLETVGNRRIDKPFDANTLLSLVHELADRVTS